MSAYALAFFSCAMRLSLLLFDKAPQTETHTLKPMLLQVHTALSHFCL